MALDPTYFFYAEGTITLTNGSDIATGDFTAWDPAVLPFDFVFPNDGTGGMSVIKEVLGMEEMRLAKPWTGPTLTNVPYFIVRWVRHTDPRIYGVRVSDYLTRLRGIPENLDEVAAEIHADREAVEAAMTTLAGIEAAIDADRQAVDTAAAQAQADRQAAAASADEAEAWAEAAATAVLPDGSVTPVKLSGLVLGQCRLVYVSATQIRLDRVNGSQLFINGKFEQIPSTGVTLSNAELSANTLYYVYAYMNAGAMALEASATIRATDNTYGHQIKSGSATRTLVGMVYTNASGQFQDGANFRFVLSWFNRQSKPMLAPSAGVTGIGTVLSERLPEANKLQFICWAGEAYEGSALAFGANSVAGSIVTSAIAVNGSAATNPLEYRPAAANHEGNLTTGPYRAAAATDGLTKVGWASSSPNGGGFGTAQMSGTVWG